MKKVLGIFASILIILTTFLGLQSCKDNHDEFTAVVYVKLLADTTIVVPSSYVRIEKYDVKVEGTTDDEGSFTHIFDQEMILDVIAVVDAGASPTGTELTGETTIRLKENKSIRTTVFVN